MEESESNIERGKGEIEGIEKRPSTYVHKYIYIPTMYMGSYYSTVIYSSH